MRNLLIVSILALAPVVAQAQESNPHDSVQFRNQCRLAAQIIRTGHPAPHLTWAYSHIPACGGEGGEALADRLRSLRHSRDTATVRALSVPLSMMRDRYVFDVAVEVAGDRSASDVARAYAFRVLMPFVSEGASPAFNPWDPREPLCGGYTTHAVVLQGAPLSPGYTEQISTLARRVALDQGEPRSVRYAARCVLRYDRAERGGVH
jgi:hypothetical protein